ncbi:MAG TPA: pilus assembly protein N-terminal domain-containing protein [Isosphaeraceae bacterium]|nr:pilus assembly protein N-terminal domain-containing protein [Isosphaeraceae bacterium]
MAIFCSREQSADLSILGSLVPILGAVLLAMVLEGPVGAQVPTPPQPSPPPPSALNPNPLGPQPAAPEPAPQPPQVGSPLSDESELTPIILPKVPLAPPKPMQGANSIDSFVESLRGNDATFDVLVNQARILTLKQNITAGPTQPIIAVGDPSIIEFTVVSPRQLRITGLRIGVTDLAITTAQNETFVFEVRVHADLALIQGKLHALFPDASIKLSQLRDHIVVEGEARDAAQITRIIQTLSAYLVSVAVGQSRAVSGRQGVPLGALGGLAPGTAGPGGAGGQAPGAGGGQAPGGAGGQTQTPPPVPVPVQPGAEGPVGPAAAAAAAAMLSPEMAGPMAVSGAVAPPQIINLMRVMGSQQVMLKVRIAELNRTALRRIGANFLGLDPRTGGIVGSIIGGPANAQGTIGQPGNLLLGNQLYGSATLAQSSGNTTVFGIFQNANFEFMLNALRQNGMLKILAEPNLVALNGQTASFLAGGEFPVPIPQVSAGGISPTITVRFREFGVRLGFVPYILDGEIIRLTVAPEVSNIDFTVAVTLVSGGSPVPGLNTRKAQTTVELREGQTLAMAGLLEIQLNANTARIPGLGDLPIIGPFFSNTSSERTEKELVVLVTPYLIEPMSPDQVPPTPGDEVKEPNDLELFFLNRIESRTGRDFRATTMWDDVFKLRYHLNLEKKYVNGPVGFSD